MSDQLFDALQVCLERLEHGEELESCLARFPQLAAELRPLLMLAANTRAAAIINIPADAQRRGRTRVLRRAAELREYGASQRRSWWLGQGFRLAAVSLALIVFMVAGGTGLVSASSGSLPGDHLYTVKRTWEDLRLQFSFTPAERQSLQKSYENERVDEVHELFSEQRVEPVTFAGVLEQQGPERWVVAGVQVDITAQTEVKGQLSVGFLVQVTGLTRADGAVVAQQISPFIVLLPGLSASSTPEQTLEPRETEKIESPESTEATGIEDGGGNSDQGQTPDPGEDHSGSGKGGSTPEPAHDGSGSGDHGGGGGGGGDGGGGDDGGGGH